MEKKEVIFGHAGDDSIDEDESTKEETCGEDETKQVFTTVQVDVFEIFDMKEFDEFYVEDEDADRYGQEEFEKLVGQDDVKQAHHKYEDLGRGLMRGQSYASGCGYFYNQQDGFALLIQLVGRVLGGGQVGWGG